MSADALKLDGPQRFNRRLATCNRCHGLEGIPVSPVRPIIWGQTAKYIDARIGDFRKGLTPGDEEMTTLLSDFGRRDIVKLSEHFAAQPWPKTDVPPAARAIAVKAEALITQADCTAGGCHGSHFTGGDVRVAGQQPEYLKTTLMEYRDEVRRNYLMESATEGLTDTDVEVLATYLAGLKP